MVHAASVCIIHVTTGETQRKHLLSVIDTSRTHKRPLSPRVRKMQYSYCLVIYKSSPFYCA